MPTYNVGLTGQTNPNVSWLGNNRVGVVSFTVDLAARGYLVPSAGFVSGDVLQLGEIPVGCLYMGGALKVNTVETGGSSPTVALAITGTAVTLLAATSISAAAATVFTGAATLMTTATGIITATFGGTLGNKIGVFNVSLVVADCR